MSRKDEVIQIFREYLKIPSVHPSPDYEPCIEFVKKKADAYGFKTRVFRLDEKRPVLIITIEGIEPQLPSILLNSHMDVVPVFEEEWTYSPFAAEMDSNGNIYARGAQDMKCVTMAQLEALRRLKGSQVKLKRTVHMTLLPDEEIGSSEGMAKFVHTIMFKELNIGFDIDEGVTSEEEEFIIFQNEKCKWGILIHCPGTSGHSSLLHCNTPGEKLRIVIDSFMDYREREGEKLSADSLALGDVTTINLTQLEGGVQNNVVPPEIVVGFDMRLAVDSDHEEIENWINNVCKEAGAGVYPEYIQKDKKVPATLLTASNPYWLAMDSALHSLGLKYKKINAHGATDARFVREIGVPAVGFSPFNHTKERLHANDEYLNRHIFLKGIVIYEKLVTMIANV